jgi:urease subunit alpha
MSPIEIEQMQQDIAVHGARKGDFVRLGDTALVVRVEADDRELGNEVQIGFGKNLRDGIGMRSVSSSESCDVVITNVLIIDALLGIRVSSIGIRAGRIHAIGRAGNPDTMDNIDVVVGSGSVIIPGEGLIATAGGIDTHVHAMSPRVCDAALASGVTTIIAQEFGPFWGVGVSSKWALEQAHNMYGAWPLNVGILGRAAGSTTAPLQEALAGGVCGFKIHEDTGAHPRTIDTTLNFADEHDIAVALHTDGLNEMLSVADTIDVIAGRAVHAFHVEGCGGGHSPDVLTMAGRENILASSTNPTLAYGINAADEHVAMIISAHGMNPELPSDVQMARNRVRNATMAAENRLHDMGVIPVTSSDALGMGRVDDTWRKTFAMASMFADRAILDGSVAASDVIVENERVLRHVAKITINPALVHGLSHEVGAIKIGLMADIVLWPYSSFASKPNMIIKNGLPAWGVVGDPGATVANAQPLVIGPQFGAFGVTAEDLGVHFTNSNSEVSLSRRRSVAVRNTRTIRSSDMIRHGILGEIDVDPSGHVVTFNGQHITSDPQNAATLTRTYLI